MDIQSFWPIKTAILILKLTKGVTSGISSLPTAAGIKSVVKMWVPAPPYGDKAALGWHSAQPTLHQLHGGMQGRRPFVLSPSCWEGGWGLQTPAVLVQKHGFVVCTLVLGRLHPETLPAKAVDLAWGMASVCGLPHQGSLTKLNWTCKNEISHENWNLDLLLKSQHIRPHRPLFLPGNPRLGLRSSCHSKWTSAHLFAVVPSLYVDYFLERNILYSCLYHKGEDKR